MKYRIVLLICLTAVPCLAVDSRPNIVLVLADDLGYGDLGCYGNSTVKTPHIDRFARQGLRFTSCYSAAPNCSPARAGIMTGRTPFRVGIYNWIPGLSPMHLRRSEITIATILRNSGYDTCHVGKWHLNGDILPFGSAAMKPLRKSRRGGARQQLAKMRWPTQPQPWDHGFQHYFATQNNALPNHKDPVNFVRNGRAVGPLKGYAADLVTDEAVRWLKSQRRKDRPFFLFVCYHEPHEPIASAPRYTKLYPGKRPGYAAHRGNVSQLDGAFGRLLQTLDHLQVRKQTLVIFTSDNGPAITRIHPHGSAGPLRDKKGSIYDGGIRVPGIVQWPAGKIRSGVSDAPVGGVDILPTLCEIAGAPVPAKRTLDGASIVPALHGKPVKRKRPLYWQFHRSRSNVNVAIRRRSWKLCARMTTTQPRPKPSAGIPATEMKLIKTARLTGFELYNLERDIGEKVNLKDQHPGVFKSLKAELVAMHREVRMEGPVWPVWKWPGYESERIVWPKYWKR